MKKRIIIALFSALTQIAFAAPGGWDNDHDRYDRGYHQPRGNAYGYYRHHPRPVPSICTPPVQYCAPLPMNPYDFVALREAIHCAPFESTRLSIFRQALNYNYFSTAQVIDLMNLFWFDNSKLELAKMAYPKTVDPQRYYLVNNAFTFSSSARYLGEYLAMR